MPQRQLIKFHIQGGLKLKKSYIKTSNRFILKITNLRLKPAVDILVSGEAPGPSQQRPRIKAMLAPCTVSKRFFVLERLRGSNGRECGEVNVRKEKSRNGDVINCPGNPRKSTAHLLKTARYFL